VGRNEQQARTQLLMRALMTSSGVRIADFARPLWLAGVQKTRDACAFCDQRATRRSLV